MSKDKLKLYIYELPVKEKNEICNIFDLDLKWMRLGEQMKYNLNELDKLKKYKSPTDQLLYLWGELNHTVEEFFILLSNLKCYDAMELLKSFVPQFYHRLCDSKLSSEKEEKILNNNLMALNIDNNNLIKNIQDTLSCNESNEDNAYVANEKAEDKAECSGGIPHVAFEEIQKAIKNSNFSILVSRVREDSGKALGYKMQDNFFKLNLNEGKGGFGVVYKGFWKKTTVAIKIIQPHKESAPKYLMEQILIELRCLNFFRHDNILSIYGYSSDGEYPCLIYQFMNGGNLDQRLKPQNKNEVLTWNQRLYIAQGVARGLQFLHTVRDKPLIHGDIKSANVLLHNGEPKIGDFGLAREGPFLNEYVKVSRIHGTRPYLPDDFLRTRKMCTSIDTYSFGIVLFEIATGQSAYSEQRKQGKFLKDFVCNFEGDIYALKDPNCNNSIESDKAFLEFIDIGKECVNKRAKDRPKMTDVLCKLEHI